MVLPFARVAAPRLAASLGGPGRVAVIGCAINAGAQLLWLSQIQAQPAYLTHLLPVQLLGGAGVGLAIPSLLGSGSASLTPARFGAGSGILNTARQIGTVVGVAGLVAILSRVSHTDPVPAYRHGVLLVLAFFVAAAAVSAALLTGRPTLRRSAGAREWTQGAHQGPFGKKDRASEAIMPGWPRQLPTRCAGSGSGSPRWRRTG
jgi:hypothetical protein